MYGNNLTEESKECSLAENGVNFDKEEKLGTGQECIVQNMVMQRTECSVWQMG